MGIILQILTNFTKKRKIGQFQNLPISIIINWLISTIMSKLVEQGQFILQILEFVSKFS